MPSDVVPPWMSETSDVQRLLEELHRTITVGPGEHPGMHHAAQRRPVRRAGQVVVDHLRDLVGRESVAEPVEQLAQLRCRQQVEQHEDVGLLGGLVPVDIVVLGLEDAVEALDVAVLPPVAIPVQFRQVAVSLELADDAVVERDEHPSAHLIPVRQFGIVQSERLE